MVGRFGEAVNCGNGGDPDEPRFCHMRDADYVSGAALMVPRALFEELGGFDEEFAPGYYEDTDLDTIISDAQAQMKAIAAE